LRASQDMPGLQPQSGMPSEALAKEGYVRSACPADMLACNGRGRQLRGVAYVILVN
jgi:hypothetical protein